VCGDRREARALDVVIRALEFEPVGPQNQWVDVMFLTTNMEISPQSDKNRLRWNDADVKTIYLSNPMLAMT